MNRGQGIVTAGVLLLGAAMGPGLRLGSQTNKAGVEIVSSTTARTAEKVKGDGPWLASCRYWEAAIDASPQPGKAGTSANSTSKEKVKPGARSRTQEEGACERDGDRWGIPSNSREVKPHITAIIAAVPDPVHTNLALEYDRAIDALMQAAADNGYLRSFFWIPWKARSEAAHNGEAASAAETAEQQKREQQPGLIVLKHAATGSENDPRSNFDEVIYLFLVGESPASGMNGAQLREALLYEQSLKKMSAARVDALKKASLPKPFEFKTSMRGPDDLAIIGSAASGSAMSLREAVESAWTSLQIKTVHIAGATETEVANHELSKSFEPEKTLSKQEKKPSEPEKTITYLSFGDNIRFEEDRTLRMASRSGYTAPRFAILAEDGTVFGHESKKLPPKTFGDALVVRFPRDISLLRNAQMKEKVSVSDAPSPYLRLTLRDPPAGDTIPHFSAEQTPLSQEAELMSIQRQLLTYHAQFLAIYASNVLDEMFLANFLHRACPNMRLVFLGSADLLFERDVDNAPYIGSLTITPYNLVGLMRLPASVPSPGPARAFPDSGSEALYNAASYIFHSDLDGASGTRNPVLAGYQAVACKRSRDGVHASLWSTVLGNDGYYPLGLVSHCASDTENSLPSFEAGQPSTCVDATDTEDELLQLKSSGNVYPSLVWTVLSIMLGLYSAGHSLLLLVAWYWSPLTRDLAISEMAEPGRRSVYMNIGAVMLFLMAVVLEVPAFRIEPAFHLNTVSVVIAFSTLAAASMALLVTVWKTAPYSWRLPERTGGLAGVLDTRRAGYLLFNASAFIALCSVTWAWWHICSIDIVRTAATETMDTKYGIFFSYRCLHPDSEVSPVVPVLLVLLGWYLWAVCQTYRLRFSEVNRPRLPAGAHPTLYVSDSTLSSLPDRAVNMKQSFHLYENIFCLLITREVLNRFMADKPHWRNVASIGLAVGYFALLCAALNVSMIKSVDRMLLAPGSWPTIYERLLAGLLAPLIFISLAGALRMVLIWGALRRGVLEPLERYPLRHSFTRLKGLGWVAMMRDTGLHLRWKDMARTGEAIRQLLANQKIIDAFATARFPLRLKAFTVNDSLNKHVQEVRQLAQGKPLLPEQSQDLTARLDESADKDLPTLARRPSLAGIYVVEKEYAAICEAILEAVLIPYWMEKRKGFVAADITVSKKGEPKAEEVPYIDPEHIQLAEELLALRYVSVIRAVLGNVRYLMTFVAAVFVLSLVAWHSYPFQPRQMGDWVFTLLFATLSSVVLVVFAQMHRDAILSRITDTSPNELGMDFYLRMATFGAVPLLTWLAYQFPSVGSSLFRLLQPGLGAIK